MQSTVAAWPQARAQCPVFGRVWELNVLFQDFIDFRLRLTRVRALRAETLFFSNIWPLARPNIAKRMWGWVKITASKATLVEYKIFLDIWKVQTLILIISELNWVILHEFGRNYSFTRQVGLIIGSTRWPDPGRLFPPVWRPQYIFP